MSLPVVLTMACVASVLGLIAADRAASATGRVVAKLAASTCFVGLAVALDATGSAYGRWILAALVFGWVGDALLLSRAERAFLAGLAAFLLSHGLFVMAFASGPLDPVAMALAGAGAVLAGWGVLRWLLPHTPSGFKGPVGAYVVVILVMVVAAAGHAVAAQRWAVLVGALLFALSDIAVARDRFVRPGAVNQLVLAWTVADQAGAP
jgi:uncharacterized membrane protein YhhN